METPKFSTFFKFVIYWKVRLDGSPYTPQEIEQGLHKRYAGSFDTRKTKFKSTITDAEEALRKMEASVNAKFRGRYKTIFIVANNYKGFEVVVRKWVDDGLRMGMGVNFFKPSVESDDVKIYNIPKADELIRGYYAKTLDKAQQTLLKPVSDIVPVALPYYGKLSDKFNNLRA